jgi:anti-anti-sigma regulatory factor
LNSSLKFEKEEYDDHVIFNVSGQIDEDAGLENIQITGVKKIVFNLNDVSMINSCGIRDWVEFQKSIDDDIQIIYRNCPQVIIEQLNIINGFIKKNGLIESFYAPYYDEKADKEFKILITPDEVIDGKAPVKKNKNGEILDFDEIELQYFNFLKK